VTASSYNTRKEPSEVFCQKCGNDVTIKYETNGNNCGCGPSTNIISSWAAKGGHMIHLSCSLNILFIGEKITIQSSPSRTLYYEL
jgi:hypothetical protein